ncbi:GNAT family N-acetyltransferase [Undibacterium curvum]|uniref:GNAT family N-acetyltransferase n=2 Tax=Undibacterium curvum TaxID=2762294 RepID=UPI003D0FE773
MNQAASFPQLQTGRFILRQIMPADQPAIFAGLSDEAVTAYYGISYDTLESTQAQMDWYELVWKTRIGIWWGIAEREHPEQLIGTCGLHEWEQEDHCAEIGFWLTPAFWRRGVMAEVLPAILACCFRDLGLHRIQALVEPDNAASWRLVERHGFQLEGILRECEYKNGKYLDLRCYSLLAHEAQELMMKSLVPISSDTH